MIMSRWSLKYLFIYFIIFYPRCRFFVHFVSSILISAFCSLTIKLLSDLKLYINNGFTSVCILELQGFHTKAVVHLGLNTRALKLVH